MHGPEDTEWGQHEGALVDPDGNVIRFGSPHRSLELTSVGVSLAHRPSLTETSCCWPPGGRAACGSFQKPDLLVTGRTTHVPLPLALTIVERTERRAPQSANWEVSIRPAELVAAPAGATANPPPGSQQRATGAMGCSPDGRSTKRRIVGYLGVVVGAT